MTTEGRHRDEPKNTLDKSDRHHGKTGPIADRNWFQFRPISTVAQNANERNSVSDNSDNDSEKKNAARKRVEGSKFNSETGPQTPKVDMDWRFPPQRVVDDESETGRNGSAAKRPRRAFLFICRDYFIYVWLRPPPPGSY